MGQLGHVAKIMLIQRCKITFIFIKYPAQNLINVSEDNKEHLLTLF